MHRGILKDIKELDSYANVQKSIRIALQECTFLWLNNFSELDELNNNIDVSQATRNHLKEIKNTVKNSFEKKFIYFICSRKMIRFDPSKQPRFTISRKSMKFSIVIDNSVRRSIFVPRANLIFSLGQTGEIVEISKISVTQTSVIFDFENNQDLTMGVHDFLKIFGINLGISNKVEYIGLTVNPEKRPFNLSHSGLSRVLLGNNNKKKFRDYFICYNLFEVSISSEQKLGFDFFIGNSWLNEIDIATEADIIEKSLILYFGSGYQDKTKTNDYSSLKNNLKQILEAANINDIHFHYEINGGNPDYISFYSDLVKPAIKHYFTIKLDENTINMENEIN